MESNSPVDFRNTWRDQAQQNPRRVLLPEGTDPRILQAAAQANALGICRAQVMGEPGTLEEVWRANGLQRDLPPVIPGGAAHPRFEEMCESYAALRAADSGRQPNLKAAKRMLANPVFLAAMLLRSGETDSVVAGAAHTTADVVNAAKYVIGMSPGVADVSSSFVMVGRKPEFGHKGAFIFADCGAIIEPGPDVLSGIVLASAESCRRLLGCEPRVALLSFSTRGSANHPRVEKMRQTLELVREVDPELIIDGELQADAAIVPDVAARKCPDSPLKGRANVLIFPDLNTGNIAYKMVERMAGAAAIGPILQGLRQPISDLSRGCKVEDIVETITVMGVLGLK